MRARADEKDKIKDDESQKRLCHKLVKDFSSKHPLMNFVAYYPAAVLLSVLLQFDFTP